MIADVWPALLANGVIETQPSHDGRFQSLEAAACTAVAEQFINQRIIVTVPNVLGMTWREADGRLPGAGFVAGGPAKGTPAPREELAARVELIASAGGLPTVVGNAKISHAEDRDVWAEIVSGDASRAKGLSVRIYAKEATPEVVGPIGGRK